MSIKSKIIHIKSKKSDFQELRSGILTLFRILWSFRNRFQSCFELGKFVLDLLRIYKQKLSSFVTHSGFYQVRSLAGALCVRPRRRRRTQEPFLRAVRLQYFASKSYRCAERERHGSRMNPRWQPVRPQSCNDWMEARGYHQLANLFSIGIHLKGP